MCTATRYRAEFPECAGDGFDRYRFPAGVPENQAVFAVAASTRHWAATKPLGVKELSRTAEFGTGLDY